MWGRVSSGKGKPWDGELVLTAIATYPAFSHLPASYPGSFGSACQALAPREGPTGWVAPGQQLYVSCVFCHQVIPWCNLCSIHMGSISWLGSCSVPSQIPNSLLGLGFVLLPCARKDLQEEGVSP